MKIEAPIGILGGTFDPVHLGHLDVAQSVQSHLNLSEIKFLPNYLPVHRVTPGASVEHRLNMLQLALHHLNSFSIDDREIRRSAPSYMIDTLLTLRQDFPRHPFCLILGADAYQRITTWKKWQALLNYTHLIVLPRAGYPFAQHPDDWLTMHETQDQNQLKEQLSGRIFFLNVLTRNISASLIRQRIKDGLGVAEYLPSSVLKYITTHLLYQSPPLPDAPRTIR